MGWNNPNVPWSELERALSGRPPLPGREPIGPLRPLGHDRPDARTPHRLPPPDYRRWNTPVRPSATADHPAEPSRRVPYAELHCHSAFSFLDGASTPEHLVAEALRLGLDALAITDHDGLYGIVRFAEAAADTPLRTLYGAELSLGLPEPQMGVADPVGDHLLVLARGQEGYNRLSVQISRAQLDGGEKGRPIYDLDALARRRPGQLADPHRLPQGSGAAGSRRRGPDQARTEIRHLMDRFGRQNVLVELSTQLLPTDDEDNDVLAELAAELGLPVVATTGAHYAAPASGQGRRGDGCCPRPAQPGRGGPVPATRSRGASALRCRDGGVVLPVPDRGVECGGHRSGVLVRPASRRAETPALRRPARSRRELPPPTAHPDRCRPPIRITGEQTGGLRSRSKKNCGSSPT